MEGQRIEQGIEGISLEGLNFQHSDSGAKQLISRKAGLAIRLKGIVQGENERYLPIGRARRHDRDTFGVAGAKHFDLVERLRRLFARGRCGRGVAQQQPGQQAQRQPMTKRSFAWRGSD